MHRIVQQKLWHQYFGFNINLVAISNHNWVMHPNTTTRPSSTEDSQPRCHRHDTWSYSDTNSTGTHGNLCITTKWWLWTNDSRCVNNDLLSTQLQSLQPPTWQHTHTHTHTYILSHQKLTTASYDEYHKQQARLSCTLVFKLKYLTHSNHCSDCRGVFNSQILVWIHKTELLHGLLERCV